MNTHINEALQDFLTNPHNENKILVIKGKWGVGKTYFWNNFIDKNRDSIVEIIPTYSYVSLFGISKISELKNMVFNKGELFSKQYSIWQICHLEFWLSSIWTTIFKRDTWYKILNDWNYWNNFLSILFSGKFWSYKSAHKSFNSLNKLGIIKRYAGDHTNAIENNYINNMLICFDDIERIDSKFPIETLMGYADELAQQKNCKIILIFNEDELEEKQRNAFNKYREKVVDIELTYSPTLNEQLRIVFGDKLEKYPIIHQVINEQEHVNIVIKNIRVLKKINQIIDDFIKITQNDLHPLVMEDFIKRTIYWSNYFYIQNDQLSFEMLKNPPIIDLKQKLFINKSTEEKQKNEECTSEKLYNQAHTLAMNLYISDSSTFTEEIIHKLEHGVWSEENIKSFISSETDRIDIIIKKKEIGLRLDDAWKLYHSGFQNNLDDIIRIFHTELENKENYPYWDYKDFINTVNSYYQFKQLDESNFPAPTHYLDSYLDINEKQLQKITKRELLSIEWHIARLDSPIREYSMEKLKGIIELQPNIISLSDFVKELDENKLSEQQKKSYIQQLTLDDILSWLQTVDDPVMYIYVRKLLNESKSIGSTVIEKALEKLASQSKLNKYRIDNFILS
ncbi:hypothetical protein B9T11_08570 [Wohlfahrtiimonas chitiniclastica]|uniref:P-loop NTPase fold protein n=1 Tax=Wohlfahrtiimonas chitiniclastica TaxID=400946 RepID=UPI000B990889|nr:P-loop NTPase fold protein [Wohlfahrtiimonas chitiniclastica]OYQ79278.1 hypothetical protein B9T11_08570 [Wohlfahrtiimonas chitiniclastica]